MLQNQAALQTLIVRALERAKQEGKKESRS
jgi:hypothetical protein